MLWNSIEKLTHKKSVDDIRSQVDLDDPDTILKSSVTSKIGDINGDGKFDAEDIKIFKEYLEGKRELSEEEKERADLNNDGKVDEEDLYKMLQLFKERREAEDRVRELESLYQALLQNENKPAGLVVLGVDNSNIEAVKNELDQARFLLATLS